MRLRTSILAVVAGAALMGGPALAQSQGADGSGSNRASAEGSSVSGGSTSSSASITTSGASNVGVVQGTVGAGSSASGGQGSGSSGRDAAAGGAGAGGQTVGAADAPNATSDGVVAQLDLPAIGTVEDATSAVRRQPGALAWAMLAAMAVGFAVLFRRLPRPMRA